MTGTADWEVAKRADLRRLIEDDLGPPGGSHRWHCPLCQDRSPNLAYNPRTNRFTCYHGDCGEHGDAIDWLTRVRRMTPLEAVAYLGGGVPGRDGLRGRATRTDAIPPSMAASPISPASSLRLPEAPAAYRDLHYQAVADGIICQAESDLWETREGRAGGLAWLRRRGLADSTIRRFRLGWVGASFESEPIEALCNDRGEHGIYVPRGVVFPYIAPGSWFSPNEATPGPRWAGAAVRRLAADVFGALPPRPDGKRPAKVLMFRETSRRSFYPHPEIDPTQGERPAILLEGEVDALLAEQAVGHAAFVATLGGAGSYPDAGAMVALARCPRVLIAVDFDLAGEASVPKWKSLVPGANRALPPAFAREGDKDLADLVAGGGDPREWIRGEFERLGISWPKDR